MLTPREYADKYNDTSHWNVIRQEASRLGSDGCTGVPDICVDACYEHDCLYTDHVNRDQDVVTREWTDALFKIRHEQQGRPVVGMILWKGARVLGRPFWENNLMFDFHSVSLQEAP